MTRTTFPRHDGLEIHGHMSLESGANHELDAEVDDEGMHLLISAPDGESAGFPLDEDGAVALAAFLLAWVTRRREKEANGY